jgi:hypothetical protein
MNSDSILLYSQIFQSYYFEVFQHSLYRYLILHYTIFMISSNLWLTRLK